MATQSGSTANFRSIGICNVTYNSVNLGYSVGDIQLKIEKVDDFNRQLDAYVGAPVQRFSGGRTIQVIYPCLETAVTQISAFMPDGTDESTTFIFGEQAGEEVTGYELVITPKATDDFTLTIYSAVPTVNIDWVYNHKSEKIISVIFDGMYDLSRDEGDMLFAFSEAA